MVSDRQVESALIAWLRARDIDLKPGDPSFEMSRDDMRAALEAAEAAAWEPIDTAPKDGTLIWATDDAASQVTFWSNDRWYKSSTIRSWSPRVWRPLPSPPKDTPHG